MYRTVALVIALAIAIGPSALLCGTIWCEPHAAASDCHDNYASTSPTLRNAGGCDDALLGVSALVPEKTRRGVSAPGGDVAVTVARYHLGGSDTDNTLDYDRRADASFDERPLTTVLRI